MSKFRDSILGCVVILASICLVVTAALAITNNMTKDIIKANFNKVDPEIYAELLPDAVEFTPLDIELPEGVGSAVKADETNYVFTVTSKGYNGDVLFMVATDMAGNYTGIRMLENSETEGFGSRVGELDYLETYYGVNSPEGVDGLSGATITSGALKKALGLVNEAYSKIG